MNKFCAVAVSVVLLAGCSARPINLDKAFYWQRSNVSDATYMEGAKAQQMLNRDISRCVTEIRELERLGSIRNATPGATLSAGRIPNPSLPEGALAQWETPERDGYLRAEHTDYHDFETCMVAKGWERMQHVPYETAERGKETYTKVILRQQYRSRLGQIGESGEARKTGAAESPSASYSGLNQ